MKDLDFDLKRWPFYWITQVSARYLQRLEQNLKGDGLDIPTWRVLMLLNSGTPRSVSYLAQHSITKLSTMTRIVKRMCDQGLAEVAQSSADARVTEVWLTDLGREARQVAWAQAQAIVIDALHDIPRQDMQALKKTLSAIVANLDNDSEAQAS
jgi:MarR family transcriptional regulator, organic hydroperoxide resistance regulator